MFTLIAGSAVLSRCVCIFVTWLLPRFASKYCYTFIKFMFYKLNLLQCRSYFLSDVCTYKCSNDDNHFEIWIVCVIFLDSKISNIMFFVFCHRNIFKYCVYEVICLIISHPLGKYSCKSMYWFFLLNGQQRI